MLGNRLKKLRQNLGLTQKELAEKIEVARTTYAMYEQNKREPDNDTLQKLADFFDVTTDYLLGRTDNKNNYDSEDNQIEYYKRKIATEFPDVDLMFKDLASLTAEDLKEVYEYIKFKMNQKE